MQNTRPFDLGGDIDLIRNHVGISRLPESFQAILEFRNDQFVDAALLIEDLLNLFQLRFQLFPFLQTSVVTIDGQFQHAHIGQGTSLQRIHLDFRVVISFNEPLFNLLAVVGVPEDFHCLIEILRLQDKYLHFIRPILSDQTNLFVAHDNPFLIPSPIDPLQQQFLDRIIDRLHIVIHRNVDRIRPL